MNLFNNGDVEFNMSEVFLKSCIHLAHVNRCQSLRQFSYEFILRKIALHDAVMKCSHNTWLFQKARTFWHNFKIAGAEKTVRFKLQKKHKLEIGNWKNCGMKVSSFIQLRL